MTMPLSVDRLRVELLDQFGDVLDVGVLITDTDLVIRGWNHWLELASGRTADQVVGHPLLEVFPELRDGPGEANFRAALHGATVLLAHRFHRWLLPLPPVAGFSEFEQMQQSARIFPLVDGDGAPDGVIAVIRDVTDRVAREEELRVAMDRAQTANRAKSEFLASMSHELRTPLAAIVGYVDVMLHELAGPVTTTQVHHLDRVRACARHLTSIIEEILTFSRLDAGKATLLLEDFDVTALARDAVAVVEPQASAKGLTLRTVMPEEPVMLRSDGTKLSQVLINLLGNAVKFTESGTVELRVSYDAGGVEFDVADSGPGIPAESFEHIFEPFTQVDQSATRTKGGTGLGLPVSRKLAQLLGGDLHVTSIVGQGSTFTLMLPFAALPSASELAAEPTTV